jgi:beta-phosphoglucomutase-like phosphatase (HAD superfamily)
VSDQLQQFEPLDADAVEVLLCDADGNLFGSEEPAFVASTAVTNDLLAELGVDRTFTPEELQRRSMGRSFRSTAQELAAESGVPLDAATLERWVAAEQRAVVAHLRSVLRVDPEVVEPLRRLAGRYRLALVSSSALARLSACLVAAQLDELLPSGVRFSAEDSLPVPTSKPDPAVYRHAGRELGVAGAAGLAVEDSLTGARSAVAAGFPTVGNLQFVPEPQRAERIEALREAGVCAVVPSWGHLAELLGVS